jgi:hypothetical protein
LKSVPRTVNVQGDTPSSDAILDPGEGVDPTQVCWHLVTAAGSSSMFVAASDYGGRAGGGLNSSRSTSWWYRVPPSWAPVTCCAGRGTRQRHHPSRCTRDRERDRERPVRPAGDQAQPRVEVDALRCEVELALCDPSGVDRGRRVLDCPRSRVAAGVAIQRVFAARRAVSTEAPAQASSPTRWMSA